MRRVLLPVVVLLFSSHAFSQKIDTLARIHGLLQYMNVPVMKDSYIKERFDATFGKLEISYGNGEKKQIQYEGLENTYGLTALFWVFDNMIKTHHWRQL